MAKLSTLDAHLGYWLRLVSNHVSHAFKLKLEKRGVTVAEWVVLRKLLELGTTAPTQLSAALGLTRGAISKLNERLETKALIEIAANATDSRQQVVALSRQGRALVPMLAKLADENDHAFFRVLSAGEQATLRALLSKLVKLHGLGGTPID